MSALAGFSHVGLSVADLDAAVAFWTGPMGLELVHREEAVAFLLHRTALVAVGLTDHGGAVTGPFDERRAGLDHLALAVPDEAALHAWVRRLDEHGVAHSGVVGTDAGAHLNLRGPDRLPVELFVLSPAGAAWLGVEQDAVAR
ncbi:VOC family protein [Geodermatophilus sp. SYSU D00815]